MFGKLGESLRIITLSSTTRSNVAGGTRTELAELLIDAMTQQTLCQVLIFQAS